MGFTLSSTGDLLGKRLSCPYITSDCSPEKKARSKAPQGESLTQEREAGHRKLEGAKNSCVLRGSPDLGGNHKKRLFPWPSPRALSTETLLLPELESTMAPEDHYHQLMSALSEAGPFEETQRLYHLGIPSHGMCHPHFIIFS